MPPTADSPIRPPQPARVEGSGKFVIIGILGLAIVAASGSWLFRYNATHRAARFWGPETAQLIRDAPNVTFYVADAAQDHLVEPNIDVSNAHGLAHLRNALLEDWNYEWPSSVDQLPRAAADLGHWWLSFEDPATGKSAVIYFSTDCAQALLAQHPDGVQVGKPISTKPIAPGLREIFAEFVAQPRDKAAAPER